MWNSLRLLNSDCLPSLTLTLITRKAVLACHRDPKQFCSANIHTLSIKIKLICTAAKQIMKARPKPLFVENCIYSDNMHKCILYIYADIRLKIIMFIGSQEKVCKEKNRNKSRSKSSNKKVFSFTPFLFTKVTTS
jgi:hypothetical protein